MGQPSSESIAPNVSPRREYPDGPIPGVGAVVLRGFTGHAAEEAAVPCAVPREVPREVLLVRRAREPMAGAWSLPGGAIELGETAAEACAREVREETGLKVEVLAPIETVDIIVRDDAGRVRFHYLVVDMLCRTADGDAADGDAAAGALQAGEDASEAVWADVDAALRSDVFALTPRACTVIRKAVERVGDWR
jgi:ADP-ribose pyrophosphatase YjhB (NUDIX family)